MLRHRRSTERQVALFMFGVILLVPPMLSVVNHPERTFGIPPLYLYLFIVWSGLIAFTLVITRRMRLDESAAAASALPSVDETPAFTVAPLSGDQSSDA